MLDQVVATYFAFNLKEGNVLDKETIRLINRELEDRYSKGYREGYEDGIKDTITKIELNYK